MATEIKYNGSVISSPEAGQTATLECANKKAITDIEVTAGYPLLITYNGEKTVVLRGETATLTCASKKMVSDVSITDVTHALYNGVRLPIIPSGTTDTYWIIRGSNLYGSTTPWYFYSTDSYPSTVNNAGKNCRQYVLAADGASWELSASDANDYLIISTGSLKWSNHDLRNGSSTATEIYFEGSEPELTDGLINPVRQQYFTLQQGRISQSVSGNYISSNYTTRVSYVGTEVKLTPFAKYKLIGVNGVRYGVQIITTSGLAEIQAGVDVTASNKLDLGWRTSGYTFTADANAAVCWLTASYSDNSNITPNDAMPVYIQRIA